MARSPRLRPWWAGILVVAWGLACALDVALKPRHESLKALPDTLRVLAASAVLFGACGLGATRLLLPTSLRRHEASRSRSTSRLSCWPASRSPRAPSAATGLRP
jgi:hypothetical protein